MMLQKIFSKQQGSIEITGNFKISIFRDAQNSSLREVANFPVINSIINLGATQNDHDKIGNYYKDYFKGKDYVTLDSNRYSEDSRVHYTADLHDLSQINKKFDLALLMSTLEHVKNPFEVVAQVKTIVSEGGFIFITVPFFYPIHKDVKGRYSDYWRFTDDSLRILFSDCDEIWIRPIDSVIRKVEDRATYWDNKNLTVAGYCALFQKK